MATKPKPHDKLDLKELSKDFKVPYAVLNSNKELQGIFNQYLNDPKGAHTPEWLHARITSSAWYNKLGSMGAEASYLESMGKKSDGTVDPNSIWGKRLGQALDEIKTQAAANGETLDDKTATTLARQYLYGVYDKQQLAEHMSAYIRADSKGEYAGAAQDTAVKLHGYLRDMGLASNPNATAQWLTQNLQHLAAGNKTIPDVEKQIQDWAASKYVWWADQIKAGATVKDLGAAYTNAAQSLLEDPSLDINDPTVQKMMTSQDKNGVPQASTVYDFEQRVRQDPRWMQTQNAKSDYLNAAMSLSKAMGLGGA